MHFLALQNRSHFTDYTVLSEFAYTDLRKNAQKSRYVVTVSNWHFVRDNQEVNVCPACRPEDCNISLKLASSTFQTATAVGPSTPSDQDFFFDRAGAIIPYSAFVSLLSNERFVETFCAKVKEEYENVCGPISDFTPDADEVVSDAEGESGASTAGEDRGARGNVFDDADSASVDSALKAAASRSPTNERADRKRTKTSGASGAAAKHHRRE